MRHEITYQNRTVILDLDNPHIEGGMNNTFYEHKMLEFIQKNYKGTFIDIGAYIGNHSIFFNLFCQAQVHAFEPVYTDDLVHNAMLNEADISVYSYGLSDSEGEMMAWDRSGGHNSAATSLKEGKGVQVKTLDSFNLKPDLIKIDVENMETQVLKGAEQTITKHKPAIFIEIVDNDEADKLLKSWGYTRKEKFNATPTYHYVHD